MDRLTELGLKYGTDKAHYHNYTPFYDEYLKDFEPQNVLEIGIFTGDSLKMWAEYFGEKTKVIGIDIDDKNLDFLAWKNVYAFQLDSRASSSAKILSKIIDDGKFCLVIDDGCHTMAGQQDNLSLYWPMLKSGGYFIMEDLHTSGMDGYNIGNDITTLDLLEEISNGGDYKSTIIPFCKLKKIVEEIDFIKFYKYNKSITCIIKKK